MNQQKQDMEEERKKGEFSSRAMTFFLDGSNQITERKEQIRSLVESKQYYDHEDEYFHFGVSRYFYSLEKFKRFREEIHQGNLSHLSDEELHLYESYAAPLHGMKLQDDMFIPSIKGQADEEQLAKWLPLAQNFDIIGCYAQTELGHGSNVRGLETTATFDPATDEIVLHSPTLSSIKWWPGSLGKTANFAMVYAKLLIPKKGGDGLEEKGIHGFICQIRDLKTHKSLPGVTTGFVGPKLGMHANDNGFLRLDHVRIPRRQMMSRYTKLDRDGTYRVVTEQASKLTYGTMLHVRANLVTSTAYYLSRAATIAIRYSAVRRQFPSSEGHDEGNGLEQKVIDFQAQQYRLFPNLATSYALLATSRYMKKIYEEHQKSLKDDKFEGLPEAHATSSGLKAVCSILASEGIEEYRKTCGGHGYLLNSGIGEMFLGHVAINTMEGENYMVIQQLSRYLIKSYMDAKKGKQPGGNARYLLSIAKGQYLTVTVGNPQDLRNPENQLAAFANRSGHLVAQTTERVVSLLAKGSSFESAYQAVQWTAIRAARAHCMYTMVISFQDMIESAKIKQPELYPILKTLGDLFALCHTERELGEFLESSQYSPIQCGWIHEQIEELLRVVRPNAVTLVDAFNYSDKELNSALGRFDGNVYEALYEWTKKDPMNKDDVIECYQDVIRPIITKQFNPKL